MPCPALHKSSGTYVVEDIRPPCTHEEDVGEPILSIPEDVSSPRPWDAPADSSSSSSSSTMDPVDDARGLASPHDSESCCGLLLPGGGSTYDEDALEVALEEDRATRFGIGAEAVPSTPPRIYWRDFVRRDGANSSDHDLPIPIDPPAASIFQGEEAESKELPPAPAWLSAANLSRKDSLDQSTDSPQASPQSSMVYLHVYELSEWTRLSGLPIFHLGIEVFRCEYYFSRDGILVCPPGHHGGHRYKEAVPLGQTLLSRREWRRALTSLRLAWPPGSYERIGINCQDFCIAASKSLGLADNIPAKFCRCADLDQILPTSVVSVGGMVSDALWKWMPNPCALKNDSAEQEACIGGEVCKPAAAFPLCSGPCSKVKAAQFGSGVEKLIHPEKGNRIVYII